MSPCAWRAAVPGVSENLEQPNYKSTEKGEFPPRDRSRRDLPRNGTTGTDERGRDFPCMTDQKTYPPISDYALIGDCRTAALISKSGSVEWLCLPDFDSPSLFCSILDREKGGHLRVAPKQPVSTSRRYVEGTNVLETTHLTETGTLRVTDFLPVIDGETSVLQPERELLRIIEAVEGSVDVEIEFVPRPNYGRAPARIEKRLTSSGPTSS